MDWNQAGESAAAAVVLAALYLLPRWFSFRHRAIAGAVLFPLGWAGVFGGLAIDDQPLMQSEAVAWLWMGTSMFALVLAVVLLVPAFFEWWRVRRKPRRTRERWSGGRLSR